MKIPEEKRIRIYELTCLVSVEHTKEELDSIKEVVSNVITNSSGKIKEIEEWGKKDLAYTIKTGGKSFDQALYFHFVFEAEADNATAIKDNINITENIIRYLLVVRE